MNHVDFLQAYNALVHAYTMRGAGAGAGAGVGAGAYEDEARQMRIVAACTRMVVVEFEGPIALDAAFVVLRESTSVYEFCFHLAVIDANKMLDDDDKKFERMFKQLSQLFRGHLDAHDAIKRLDAFQEEMNNV